jgi:hypothetical protein
LGCAGDTVGRKREIVQTVLRARDALRDPGVDGSVTVQEMNVS